MAAAGHHSSKILQHVDCLNFLQFVQGNIHPISFNLY